MLDAAETALAGDVCLEAIHNQLAVDLDGSILLYSAPVDSIQLIARGEVGNSQPLWRLLNHTRTSQHF